jgi:hydroxyacylglutathione hydrolase
MLMKTLAVGPLGCNCTILADETSRDAVVIDPGDDVDKLLPLIEKQNLKVRAMLHTHAHLDHVTGTRPMKEATQGSIMLHRGDAWLYENLPMQASLFGWPQTTPLPVDEWVEHGQTVRFGSHAIDVIHTPGHTPGSICFHLKDQGLLFSGDTLFQSSIGRTDLWGGSYEEIIESITGRLMELEDKTRVICGHGPETSIGAERRKNPFILQHTQGS